MVVVDGWEMNMVIGIDFTGSNGNPVDPTSLHYIDPRGASLNSYERTYVSRDAVRRRRRSPSLRLRLRRILSLGDVLTQYDKDQLFPLYGFGGRAPSELRLR
jgi:hypothetical protein